MMNNKKIKKTVASILTCALTCALLPASESFAARNKNWSTPSVATQGAVKATSPGAVFAHTPNTVSHGGIVDQPDVNGRGDWDFSDISSWMDGIDWDAVNWESINWNVIDWNGINWDNIDWDTVLDMFPVTGGAIGGKLPQNNWPNMDWPNMHQRPVTTGGAIDGDKQDDTDKHKKPVATGGAIDTTKPEKDPSDQYQKPEIPDNQKENSDEKKPEKDTTDVHNQPVATVTNGAVNTQVPDSKEPNKEQKTTENTVPADTVSNDTKTATPKKKAKIKVSTTSKKIKKGKKYKIKYSVVSGSGEVTFKSSNNKIATVNSKGVVRAKKKGTVTITVKIANGNSKKVKITVK